MFENIGFVILPDGRWIPQLAENIVKSLNDDTEPAIAEAIKNMGPDRANVSGIILPDLLRMQYPDKYAGQAKNSDLQRLVAKILKMAGYISEDPPYVIYRENPQLTLSDLVDNMLTSKIPWPTKDTFGGEKATLLSLKTVLPIVIREIARTLQLKDEYLAYLRMALGNIGYKILHAQPITQAEKTFFLAYGSVGPSDPGALFGYAGYEKRESGGPVPISALANANPLVAAAFELMKQSAMEGPGIRFFKMQSTQNFEALLYYFGPHSTSLPLCAGYVEKFGSWNRLKMVKIDDRTWPDSELLTGIRDRYKELEFKGGLTEAEKAAGKTEASDATKDGLGLFTMVAPIRSCGPAGLKCPDMYLDLPNVNLHLKDSSNCATFTWSYTSEWRQRVMRSESGATAEMLYLDMALKNPSIGGPVAGMLNIDSLELAFLHESVFKRQLTRADDQIRETIYYIGDSNKLVKREVIMTDFYTRAGTAYFRPAMAEYYQPARAQYFTVDEPAVEFITSRLGLNREQAFRNKLAIAISHNVALFQRIATAEPPFEVDNMILTLLNADLPTVA